MSEIELDIIVDVTKNHLTVEEFTDKFIEWIEENNWTCGGVFKWGGEND